MMLNFMATDGVCSQSEEGAEGTNTVYIHFRFNHALSAGQQ